MLQTSPHTPSISSLAMVAQACDPVLQRRRQEDLEFKANLSNIGGPQPK